MSFHRQTYSYSEKEAAQLWANLYSPENDAAFWQAYDSLLAQVHQTQKDTISVATYHPSQAMSAPTIRKVSLSRLAAYILALFVGLWVVLYFLVNNRPAEEPVLVAGVSNVEVEPPQPWGSFKATQSPELKLTLSLPDSLLITSYKMRHLSLRIRQLKKQVKKNKRMLDKANDFLKYQLKADDIASAVEVRNKYEQLTSESQNKLNETIEKLKKYNERYDKAYKEYMRSRRMNQLAKVQPQGIEKAWRDVMSDRQSFKNISRHNQPVLDLAMKDELNWLFVANIQSMTLLRVIAYQGEYFALNGLGYLEPIDPATQTIYKAQIKVYYLGQLVTHTPQEVYCVINQNKHKIAIKNFDKLEKRLEISQHYSALK